MKGSIAPSAAGALVKRPTLPALTGVRFFAALAVVLFHLVPTVDVPWRPVRALLVSGHAAVGLFFVLSGFILAYNYGAEGARLERGRFWIARFARIYPVYALGLVIALPFFARERVEAGQWGRLALEATSVLGCVQAWFPPFALAWNKVAWSLSVEAFFYASFPFLAPYLLRGGARRSVALIAGAWIASMTLVALYGVVRPDGPEPATLETTAYWATALRYHPLARLPEFVVGVALGRLFLLGALDRFRAASGVLALVSAATVLAVLASDALPYLWVHNGALLPFECLLLVALALGGGALGRVLASRPLVLLGESSYALYILHVPLAMCLHSVLKHLAPGLLDPDVLAATTIASSVALSVVVYRAFEVPMREQIRAMFGDTPRAVAGAGTEERTVLRSGVALTERGEDQAGKSARTGAGSASKSDAA